MKAKRQFGGCRSLIHYRRLLDEYLAAKRLVVRRELRLPEGGGIT